MTMAVGEQEMLEEQQEILEEQREVLEEVREIKSEAQGRSMVGRLFLGSLAGAAVGGAWVYRGNLAGLTKRVAARG